MSELKLNELPATDVDKLLRLAIDGIDSIIRGYEIRDSDGKIRVFDRELSSIISLMLSESFTTRFSYYVEDYSRLNVICARFGKAGINILEYSNWNKILTNAYTQAIKDPIAVAAAFNNGSHFINYYNKNNKDVDWMTVYSVFAEKQKLSSWISDSWSNALNKFFETDTLSARLMVEADLFNSDTKPDSSVRSVMYQAYIKHGFLDKKKARKIRSESSEYASNAAVSFLLEEVRRNPELYPNIDELLLQFSDSKHESVQYTIANNAPYRILYSFVNFEAGPKSIIDRRMQNGG